MSNFIAIDLELEQPKTNSQTPDSFIEHEQILSLGVCVGDENGKILHKENIFYLYEHPISAFIKDLTGITEANVVNGVTPLAAFERLVAIRDQFDASRVLLEWGSGDYSSLMKEAGLPMANSVFGRSGLNVKHHYRTWCMAHQMSPSGGLKTSMNKFTKNSTDPTNKFFKFEGDPHRSDVDAYNTYRFYIKLMKTMI
jgi:inhibitor of KinA sporulation pathway (predicted exonuclease)